MTKILTATSILLLVTALGGLVLATLMACSLTSWGFDREILQGAAAVTFSCGFSGLVCLKLADAR